MRLALFISGTPRTFVFKEQIHFYKMLVSKLRENAIVDVYVYLKLKEKEDSPYYNFLQSEEGLKNLDTILEILNPVYFKFHYKFPYENDTRFPENNMYYSQLKRIDEMVEESYNKYDYYICTRPDCILTGIPENFDILDKNVLYTSNRYDSKGNDQMFVMSNLIVKNWWIDTIRPSIDYYMNVRLYKTPEFYIFNDINPVQLFSSGLIRDYEDISSWVHENAKLNIVGLWNDTLSYSRLKIPLRDSLFFKELECIIKKYKGILSEDLQRFFYIYKNKN